jgi:uncharacterized protein
MRPLLTATALGLLLALAHGPAVEAGQARIAAGGLFSVPVVSYKERFFQTVVRQQYDYSCGSAAVATLLTHHYGLPTSEAEAFAAMYEHGDRERIEAVGFSLLDIKSYLDARGFQADGFAIPLETLAEVGIPAIALIETNGYRHFVVVKGLSNGTVLVGDPAQGLKTYDLAAFEDIRVNDIVFVVRNAIDLGRASFNRVEEWRLRQALAPMFVGINRHGFDGHAAMARVPAQIFTGR